jgi:tetratricopeptide (TPR) repeat protein
LALSGWLALNFQNFATVAPVAYIDNPLAHVDAITRVLRATEILWSYVGLMFLPIALLPDRSYAVSTAVPVAGPLALIAWLALMAAAWTLRKRAPRAVFFCLWIPTAFVATSNVAFPVGTIMAERLAYTASAGACLLFGLALGTAAARGRVLAITSAIAGAATIFVFGLIYDDRARVWSSDQHYHEIAAAMSPNSAKAHHNLGLIRARNGDTNAAARSFERAIRIYPGYSQSAYYLASIYKDDGRMAEARDVWLCYLAEHPEDIGAHSQLIHVLVALNDYVAASEHARIIYEYAPETPGYREQLILFEKMLRDATDTSAP